MYQLPLRYIHSGSPRDYIFQLDLSSANVKCEIPEGGFVGDCRVDSDRGPEIGLDSNLLGREQVVVGNILLTFCYTNFAKREQTQYYIKEDIKINFKHSEGIKNCPPVRNQAVVQRITRMDVVKCIESALAAGETGNFDKANQIISKKIEQIRNNQELQKIIEK